MQTLFDLLRKKYIHKKSNNSRQQQAGKCETDKNHNKTTHIER